MFLVKYHLGNKDSLCYRISYAHAEKIRFELDGLEERGRNMYILTASGNTSCGNTHSYHADVQTAKAHVTGSPEQGADIFNLGKWHLNPNSSKEYPIFTHPIH